MKAARLASLLLLFLCLAAPARAADRVLLGREGKGFLESIDGQLVLHVEGAPREMGLQHGRLLARQAKEDVRAYLDDFAVSERKHSKAELVELWKKHLPSVPPEYVEELEGLAEGAGIDRSDLFAAHAIPTIYHCSGAALSGPATRDGKLYHYRSLDYSLTLGGERTIQENAVLFVRKPAGGVAHMVVGWAGIVGCLTGMSAEGISVGEMGSKSRDEERGAGTPMMIQLLSVLAGAKTGEDALQRFRDWKRGEGYNFIVGDGKSGKAWAIEVTRSKIAVFGMGDPAENQEPHFAIEHCVRRVNHFVAPDLAATQRDVYDPRKSEVPSWLGYAAISNFIKESYGRFDGEKMIALCRGYPPEHPCLHQAVMCPTDGRFWVANAVSPKKAELAGAQNQRFYAYDLKALLGTGPEEIARKGGEPGSGTPTGPAGPTSEPGGRAKATRLDLGAVADAALRADLAAFDPPQGAPAEFEWRSTLVRAAGGKGALSAGEVIDVTFSSPLPSGVVENDTVYCRYYAPQDLAPGARAPGAIVLHHLGGSFEVEAALADYLAKSGVAALQVEFPYYGPRRPKDGRAPANMLGTEDFGAGLKVTRQAIADVRRAADWLVARPDVDADRVGIVGISLGGIVGSIAAGVDPRLKRNVFIIAGGDLAAIMLNESRETRDVRARLAAKGIGRDELAKAMRPIDPLRYASRIDARGTLMLNARQDEVIPKPCTEQLWEAASRPEIVWYECGHKTIAVFFPDLIAKTRAHFLRAGEATAGVKKPASGVF
jgi:dienelactone hydrolase